ncbi:flagellar hook-length control protein FliK [Archangium violaceum]|uniref:flagellar hook-length control protein FliK n=1 Tax=Archangium violaceum TaxID=83451 RepID=UPI00193B177B|nr:flagellar hook-length control protein FliK [Archangium violaceum]QRK09515.1 flagellar hook-length control protein FliK [Archangium violaceum]
MAIDSDSPKPASEAQAAAPELRLLDRRAFVGFPPLELAPGLSIADFALQIPDVTFPFNVSAGASRYQRKKLLFGFLELHVDAELVVRKVAELAGRVAGLEGLKLHFRPGYLEGQAFLQAPERTPLTFKVAFDADGERLALYLYDVRLYGFSSTPSVQVPGLIAATVAELGLLPEVEVRGATGFSTRVLPALCQKAAVSRGFKMPVLDTARLSSAEVSSAGLRLRFTSGGLPPPAPPDEELLLALEGARAFADAEALIAQGRLAEARDAWLQAGDAQDAHPFAAERLLSLLVADPQAHDLALDVAATLLRRREKSPAALWGEAVVRERRGEHARAAERYLALCALSRRASEEAAAFFSAEAAARAARDHAPQVAVKALHEVLGLRPDHLPSLKALARASDQSRDRAGAVRAYRRIAALARDPAEAADAHVHLARLCAQTEDDVAGARLHCEAALRLSPDQPDALLLLGELCHRGGEHLRALKALDRLREVAMARHELDRVGRANLLAGRIWEEGLQQPDNALLRYREAVSLLPGEPEPLFSTARVAEKLGKLQEALAGYQQALELAGPAPRSDSIRQAAHQSHHALARLYRTKLGDPARAREHLEAALALDPRDASALDELIPYFRATGRTQELAEALEKAAAVHEEPGRRAALWAEAGELYRGRLQQPEKAERLLTSALEADPDHKPALESLLAIAEARRDGGLLTRCLSSLARLTTEPRERAQKYRRLAVAARDLAFDLDLAATALQEVLKAEPDDLPTLGELCALQRKRADMAGLANALEDRARVAEAQGDKRLAATALRELANVLEARLGRLGEALVALEKAARLSPDQAVLLELADLSLRCERPEHARRALETLLSTLPRTTAPERLADIRSRLGRACELAGDREAAIAAYAQAFPLRRLDDALASRLEALYTEAGETRELAELWASRAQALVAAERSAEAAPLFLQSARVLLERGEKGPALLRLSAALDANPSGPLAAETLDALAELELERGEKLEAARLFARKAALVTDARAGAKLLFRASVLAMGTSREEAFLAEALERDASFAPARVRRGELRMQGDARSALEDFEAVLALPATDPDALREDELLELTRRASSAAVRAGRPDAARRLLAQYCALAPEDLEAQVELAGLHRKAGAREPLADQLALLWPRLSGDARRSARRELAELSLALGRPAEAADALRSLLAEEPHDTWATQSLLELLPPPGAGTPQEEVERLTLLGTLISAAEGDARAELLARRAALHRNAGRAQSARDDFLAATKLSRRPAPLWLALAALAREAGDDVDELEAWRNVVVSEPDLAERARVRLLALASTLVEKDARAPAREALLAAVALPLSPAERCDAFFALATLARRDGQSDAEAEALAEAARQGPVPRRVEALLSRASLLEKGGSLPEAANSLESALSLAPRHAGAISALHRVLREMEDWARLASLLAAEAPHAPPSEAATLYAELGTLYLERLEQPEAAEAALRQAVRLAPENVDVRRRLVALVADRGDSAEAAKLLDVGTDDIPSSEAATLLREGASHARAAGDMVRALELARRAHVLVPARDAQLAELAELLFLHGEVVEALPLQEQLAAAADFSTEPESAEKAWLRLGALAEKLGDSRRAVSAYKRLLIARPLNEVAVHRLASLLEKDEPRAAFEVLVTHARALPPSDDTAERLVSLAERARESLADAALAASLLARAAEMAEEPLPLHQALADLYRDTGHAPELMAQLQVVAALCQERGDLDGAISACAEHARLAEESGRVDDSLRSLEALRFLLEKEDRKDEAAAYERHRAEMLRDAKLDLSAAEAALERAFALSEQLDTARMGIELAVRRDDTVAEARWLERVLPLLPEAPGKATSLLRLAKLHLEVLDDSSKAEGFLREALRLDRSLQEAETLLCELLEREGRVAELAAWFEDSASHEEEPTLRAQLLLRAATLYRERAGRPDAAVIALLAARSALPDDLGLTRQAADLLHELGRDADAAEFDALLLEADPFQEPLYSRHRAFLTETEDLQSLAALMLRRAQKQPPAQAAESYLAAAKAFREAGALERALLCEDQAFELAPSSAEAFHVLRARAAGDVRRLAELLSLRAASVPSEQALPLLRERADLLLEAGESLLAAQAFDDYLAHAGDDVDALATRAELAAKGGGPNAAQPYDRRLLAAGGESLPVPVRVRTHLRLGHASLSSGAYRDAAESFEAVVALEPEGARGQEALSLLAEVYGRTGDSKGLYRASLKLARKADAATAEVLYRRAADLFEDPRESIDALLHLTRLRPADAHIIDRAVTGLRALGRPADLLAVYEAGAEAAGGSRAAELLMAAAEVAAEQLDDPRRAAALRERAAEADPTNVAAIRALVEGLRERGEQAALLEALERLVPATEDADEASLLRLELASLASAAGRESLAREALEAVVARGTSGAGYAEALEALEPLLAEEPGRLAEVRLARAELLANAERRELLLSASREFEAAGRLPDALRSARAAVSIEPDAESLGWVARLHRAAGETGRAAQALLQAARLAYSAQRPALLLEAADLWESAGERIEALEVLERLASEAPGTLGPVELAERFTRLGAPARAVEVGFGPALESGDLTGALALAERAGDMARVRQALWALVARPDADASHVTDLTTGLRAEGDWEGLLRLAELLTQWDAAMAMGLRDEVLRAEAAPAEARLLALESFATSPGFTERLRLLLSSIGGFPEAVAEVVLTHVRALSLDERVEALSDAADGWPERRGKLLRERFRLQRDAGRTADAADTLGLLILLETDPKARASLHVEHGDMLMWAGDKARAQEAFEKALEDAPGTVRALEFLLPIYDETRNHARFVVVAEQLAAILAGPAAMGLWRERLAEAYEALGRLPEAAEQLKLLPETPERLERRVRIAEAQGLTGEALQLRERLTDDPATLEGILRRYLDGQLVVFAVRLAERLFQAGQLSMEAKRLVAERLSPTYEGAALAIYLWPELLRRQPVDADGWTLYAEALVACDDVPMEVARVDGFGAALVSSTASASAATISRVALPEGFRHPLPPNAVAVTAEVMPRLHAALRPTLKELGAESLRVFLNPAGGVEAYLASPDELVLGAGTLACFGPVELSYLCALALCLGGSGEALTRPGPVQGFDVAAVAAFRAVPASLAASRVLAHLSPEVRGSDPSSLDVGTVLRTSTAFRAVALAALETV